MSGDAGRVYFLVRSDCCKTSYRYDISDLGTDVGSGSLPKLESSMQYATFR